MSCTNALCTCEDHGDERPLPPGDLNDAACERLARFFLDSKYEEVPPKAYEWVAKRIRKGLEDDLEDLERDGHVQKAKVPF